MLSEQALERVRAAVEAAERTTDAEFVTVLAREADPYHFISTVWAAMIALLVPGAALFGPWWITQSDVFILQLVVFAVLTGLFRLPWLKVMLVPRSIRIQRASDLAYRQFLEQGVHRTDRGLGVLFFVAEAEHYAQLIADSGIDAHVDQAEWQRVIDVFTARVKKGEVEAGFLQAITAVGVIMQRVAPASTTRDELPNHLILL